MGLWLWVGWGQGWGQGSGLPVEEGDREGLEGFPIKPALGPARASLM